MFNFEINAQTVQSSSASSSKSLKGGEIHRVKLVEVKEEKVDVKARAAQGNYPAREAHTDTVLTIVTGNAAGETYTDRFFSPDASSAVRQTNDKGNVQPSPVEQLQNKITQYLIAYRPALMKQIESGEATFKAKDWAGFRKLVVTHLTKALNKNDAFLKLGKNKQGYAETARYPAAMAKDKNTGELRIFTGSTFIHSEQDKVEFSKYEMDQLAALASAKPSNMRTSDIDDEDLDPELDDDDLGELDEEDDLPL